MTSVTASLPSTSEVAVGTVVEPTTTTGIRAAAASAAAAVARSAEAPGSNDTATARPRTPISSATAAAVSAMSAPVSRTIVVTPSERNWVSTAVSMRATEPTR
ncbi:unannotated protein [freshwater metagenome]|uniref:Unannotated protein n=1 Tax=freshwater metagenome TaxID=449393 RepID=A0A6J7BRM4_9ZZZZ